MKWRMGFGLIVLLVAGAAVAGVALAQLTDTQTASGTVNATTTSADLYICEPGGRPGPACGSDDSGLAANGSSAVTPKGYAFAVAPDAGRDTLNGRPAIAADGTHFFVVWRDSLATIAGARVSHDSGLVDSDGISIANGDGHPSVAFDGTNYLVVWVKDNEIYGARVSPAGTVMDATPLQLTTGANAKVRPVAIAFDGQNYLTAWRTLADDLYATRITTDGANLDGPTGFQIGHGFYPWAAFDGSNYLIIWHAWGNGLDIFGARVTPEGEVLDPGGFPISSAAEDQDHGSLAFDGTNYLVVWHDTRGGDDHSGNDGTAYGARVTPGGVVLDSPAIRIADNVRPQVPVVVTFDGTDYLVAWHVAMANAKFRLVDIFGRRVSTDGVVLDEAGIPIATSFAHQFNPRIAFDDGVYFVAWNETINPSRCRGDCIYGQLLEKQAVPAAASHHSDNDARNLASFPQPRGVETAELWVAESIPTSEPLYAIWTSDPENVHVVGENGTAFRYDGSDWSADSIGPKLYDVWGSGPADIWTTGWCWGAAHYDGQAWSWLGCQSTADPVDPYPMATAVRRSGATILTVGVAGGVQLYDGASWHGSSAGVPVDLWDLSQPSPSITYAVGEVGTVLRYDGSNWTEVPNVPTIQSLNAIWAVSEEDIFVVGDFGTIIHYDGASWTIHDSGTTEHLFGIWGLSSSEAYAVGYNGTILRFDGSSWAVESSGTDSHLIDVAGSETRVWAVGDDGVVLRRSLADADGDGMPDASDNCPAWPNADQSLPPWPVAADDPDCDGWSTDDENFIGTDPNLACSTDNWPPDFNSDHDVNIFDVNILKPAFFSTGPNPPYQARLDLKPDNKINIFDVNRLKPVFFLSCTP